MRISINEVNWFLRCRRLWDYGSSNRKNLSPVKQPKALFLGSGVHAALEAFYARGARPAETFTWWAQSELVQMQADGAEFDEQERQDLEDAHTLACGMLDHYCVRYGDDPAHDVEGIHVLKASEDLTMCEVEFAVPIPDTDGLFVGRFDGLIRDAHGRVWVIEHKTFSGALPLDWLILNQQTLGYTYAAQVLANAGVETFTRAGIERGTMIHGTLYNGLRKAVPRIPKPLVKGGLSIAAIDTTADVYRRAIEAEGLNVRDYRAKLSELEARGNTFFHREYIARSGDELEIFEKTLARVYHEMASPTVAIYPTPITDCVWQCAYMRPCIAAQTGADEAEILDIDYRQRPPRGSVYADAPLVERPSAVAPIE